MKKHALILIDAQREYVTEGRPFFIRGIEGSLDNAAKVLTWARELAIPVYHVRHLQDGNIFRRDSEFSEYIGGFEPRDGEAEHIKSNFSCFSDPRFALAMESHRDHELLVVGYGSSMCCLSTIIDGYHRGYKMTFVKDASAAKAGPRFDEASTHEYMIDTIGTFAKLITTAALVEK